MSERAFVPRDPTGGGLTPSLSVTYVCLAWGSFFPFAALTGLLSTGIYLQPDPVKARESSAVLVLLLTVLASAFFPVITINVRLQDGHLIPGGHLVATGRRWPAAEVLWSCLLHDASSFAVESLPAPKGPPHRVVALRTVDGQSLGLTPGLFPAAEWMPRRAVARLNRWLAEAQGHARSE